MWKWYAVAHSVGDGYETFSTDIMKVKARTEKEAERKARKTFPKNNPPSKSDYKYFIEDVLEICPVVEESKTAIWLDLD